LKSGGKKIDLALESMLCNDLATLIGFSKIKNAWSLRNSFCNFFLGIPYK
jgi:hypothetical protein